MKDQPAFEELLSQLHGEPRIVVDIQEQPHGSQGASGAQVRYFNVRNTDPQGAVHEDRLVTKSASLLERRLLHLLSSQGCAVPPIFISDMTSHERELVYMPYLEARLGLDLDARYFLAFVEETA